MKYIKLHTSIHVPKFKLVLEVLHQLVEEKLIKSFVLSGGYAVAYYIDPIFTSDIYFLCTFSSSFIIDLSPVYKRLKELGFDHEEDFALIHGVPVQFLAPKINSLTEEAAEHTKEAFFKGVPFKVIYLEYLMAIMVELGRPQDKMRLHLIITENEDKYDEEKFKSILSKFKLSEKWEKIKSNF